MVIVPHAVAPTFDCDMPVWYQTMELIRMLQDVDSLCIVPNDTVLCNYMGSYSVIKQAYKTVWFITPILLVPMHLRHVPISRLMWH